MMRFVIWFIAVFTLVDATASNYSCKDKNPSLNLEISLEPARVSAGQTINLAVTISNKGVESVRLFPYMVLESYWLRFEVVDEKEQQMRWLGPEVKMLKTSDRVTLDSGYNWGKRFTEFERIYDLSKPGIYSIRAIYGVAPDRSCPLGKLFSNKVRLVVY